MQRNPIATYRLQLHSGFGFDAARSVIPYVSNLGVSHLYLSPILQAAVGSTHGYDVVDPTNMNEELGGEAAFLRLVIAARSAKLSLMIDIVPNHMSIVGRQNPWWWDVLENGPASSYASYFDVDWSAADGRWTNKILMPVLGDHYGRVLEKGELSLQRTNNEFTLRYYDHEFPIDLASLAPLLSIAAATSQSPLLGFLAESCSRLPLSSAKGKTALERRARDKVAILQLLGRLCREESTSRQDIDDQVALVNKNEGALHQLIESQNYRLAYWRTSSYDLGYRRFFDVDTLAGLRMEDRDVFDATHSLIRGWCQKGYADGLRVDHPDGLRDPDEYFRRLRAECPNTWIVAEKILQPGEHLPTDWQVDGTTGYDFLNACDLLFVDQLAEYKLTRFYEDFTGIKTPLDVQRHDAKRFVLKGLLGGEVERVVSLLVNICEKQTRYRDFSRAELRQAVTALIVQFSVYRTYVRQTDDVVSPEDSIIIAKALTEAIEGNPHLDRELPTFIADILLLKIRGDVEQEFILRFQQLSSVAMAKGIEDTLFYRYFRLTCLNEVGGDISRFGCSVEDFHAFNEETLKNNPLTLLASSTHDTKRSEDVRHRIAVLSEIPDLWNEVATRWSEQNEKYRSMEFKDRNTEYLIYQTLVGTWPISVERMQAYLEKATREAKLHTSWINPEEAYEAAVKAFLADVLADAEFTSDLESFLPPIVQAGYVNSLSATLLRLTSPGIPDVYQGNGLWDLSLVDPDNRRDVDFEERGKSLAQVMKMDFREAGASEDKGLIKLFLTQRLLRLRSQSRDAFSPAASYEPINASGEHSDSVVAFFRGGSVLSIAQRFSLKRNERWGDTILSLPKGRWRDIFTDDVHNEGAISLQTLLQKFPVACLVKES